MESLRLDDIINRARKVTKPHLHEIIPVWFRNASGEELKGLKLIESILKYEGKKRFKNQMRQPSHLASTRSMNSFRTRYNEEFGNIKVTKHHSDIFKYRKLRELDCSSVMTPENIKIIEAWQKLDECNEYQDYILAFLRSVQSASHVYNKNQISINKSSFSWYNPEDLARSRSPQHKQDVRLIKARSSVQLPSNTILPSIKRPQIINPDKTYYDFPNARKLKLAYMKGSGSITSMGSSHSNTTSYQEDFQAHPIESKRPKKLDYYTSSSIKLLPDNSN